jgi:hypothetical protein
MFARSDIYFRLHLLLIIIHITCISPSLRRTSAHIHLTSVLGVLGTQETSCIVIAELLERDTFDLFLPEFDKPWVIHLRETYCYPTNLCTWRPNTVYKNRSMRRHQHSMLYIVWSRLCWCISPQKLLFCYHLPSRGRARVKLGDTWYVSNISIIFYAPCLFIHHFLCVLFTLWGVLCIFWN